MRQLKRPTASSILLATASSVVGTVALHQASISEGRPRAVVMTLVGANKLEIGCRRAIWHLIVRLGKRGYKGLPVGLMVQNKVVLRRVGSGSSNRRVAGRTGGL